MRALLTGVSTLVVWGIVCAASARAAFAQETEEDERGVDIHGFVSQGFIKSTNNNSLAESERGSFDFTEVGINFTSALSDRLRIGLQLFAHDLGPLGNYKPRFDWLDSDDAVVEHVLKHRGGLGYVSAGAKLGTVKVVPIQ